MRKYLYIFKTEIMSNLQYIFNILVGFIGFFIVLFIFLNLWNYMYDDPSQLINGYTKNQMIWYVIITEILWMTLEGRTYCKKICNDVRSGNIAYNINKPYNYILYSLSNHLGSVSIKFIVYIILGMIMGYIFMGSFPNLNILSILAILITGILATVISILLITFIGLCSFIIEDANPFYWLYSKFILILGTVFPIEYFPKTIQPILTFSPVYVVSYGPAKLFVDFNINNFISIIIAQIIYIIIGYFICSLMYKKGVRKLNVNGG
ncbi:MAG: ABC transporter permease [Bacilli bacterium]|nr:ABC transporter permease [Bacilli bacterium]